MPICDRVGVRVDSVDERQRWNMTIQINIPAAEGTLLHRIASEHGQWVDDYVIHLLTCHCKYLHEHFDQTIVALRDYSYDSIPEMAAELVQSATDSHRILAERRR